MIEMCAHHWNRYVQPVISNEMRLSRCYNGINEFLGARRHEFTDHRKPDYKFRIWFDDSADEIMFKLKYPTK